MQMPEYCGTANLVARALHRIMRMAYMEWHGINNDGGDLFILLLL